MNSIRSVVAGSGVVSTKLVSELTQLNADLLNLEAEELRLQRAREQASQPLFESRLKKLQDVLALDPLDRGEANRLLRALFEEVVIDLEARRCEVVWRHGDRRQLHLGPAKTRSNSNGAETA
jgi:hypothetical protein